MSYKQNYVVLNHNGKMILTGTARECCITLGLKIKSFFNANYVDKSLFGYVILKQEQLKDFPKLMDLVKYCRVLDRRWVDTALVSFGDFPVYRDNKKDCINSHIAAKEIEKYFTEEQITKAEQTYNEGRN
jgi:hypothetical protein